MVVKLDVILNKKKLIHNQKHQGEEDLAVKSLAYNTYILNGRPIEMYGPHQMTIKTFADIQDVNLLSIDMQTLTLFLTMTDNHHLT